MMKIRIIVAALFATLFVALSGTAATADTLWGDDDDTPWTSITQ